LEYLDEAEVLSDRIVILDKGKIKLNGVDKTVLIFGGGYDVAQDSASVRATDSIGRTVYIADALNGERLWAAGKDGASPVAEMEYSIPARVVPLDVSGDGFTDRLYVADTGGQVFRFDIDNTNNAVLSSSIKGGRILDIAGTTNVDARRFYYPPDVALRSHRRSDRNGGLTSVIDLARGAARLPRSVVRNNISGTGAGAPEAVFASRTYRRWRWRWR